NSLIELFQIPGLRTLSLQDTQITDAGLPQRAINGHLESVDLSGAALTPGGIEVLAKTTIPELTLSRTSIDNAKLLLFAGNDGINYLDVSQTKVTADGIVAFYEARKRRLAATGRQ